MMKRKRMPKSLRKYIRLEKARIRRQVFDSQKQKEFISELYKKLAKPSKTSLTGLSEKKPNTAERVEVALLGKENETTRNIQPGNK